LNRGIHVNNPELQARQRELVVEQERTSAEDCKFLRERSSRNVERDSLDMGWSR